MNFREILQQHPFIRILFPFAIGIVIADKFSVNQNLIISLLLISGLFLFMLIAIKKYRKKKILSFLTGIFLALFFIHLGILRIQQVTQNMQLSISDSCTIYKVRATDYITPKNKTDLLPVTILQTYYQQKTYPQTAKGLLYIPKKATNSNIVPGNCLYIKTTLNRVTNNGNPYEFDYARYLKTKHILHTAYLKENQYRITTPKAFSLREKALFWRNKLLHIYKEKGINGVSYDILSALTLGNKTNLDPEIKQAWSNAGAIHVLAVSGLHVGIIYLIANFFLRYLLHWKNGRWIRALFLLIILWLYALITGLSPSVMRATCMFSFVILGEAVNRRTAIFNSLAASATLLLIYNPFLLFSLGFQFSYIAVFGIVLIQPHLEKMLYIPNKFVFYFWQLTTVTLAAQIATFPLTIYYFHQFPTYFLLSGYIVITAAGILIYLSAFLLFFHNIEFISNTLGWILQHSTNFINKTIVAIQQLPNAVQQNCYFSLYETVILYLLLISLLFIFIEKNKKTVFYFLLLLIFLRLPIIIQKIEPTQHEFVVFNTKKNSLLAFREGKNVLFLHNKQIEKNQLDRLTIPYILKYRIKNISTQQLRKLEIIKWNNKNYVIVSQTEPFIDTILHNYSPTFLIFREKGLRNNFAKTYPCKYIIDNSILSWDIKKYGTANALYTKENGAFIFKY